MIWLKSLILVIGATVLLFSPVLIIHISELLSRLIFKKYLDEWGNFTIFKAVILVILIFTYYITVIEYVTSLPPVIEFFKEFQP